MGFGGYLVALILPPLAVAIQAGCGHDLLINLGLCCLAWLPGIIHAWHIVHRHDLISRSLSPAARAHLGHSSRPMSLRRFSVGERKTSNASVSSEGTYQSFALPPPRIPSDLDRFATPIHYGEGEGNGHGQGGYAYGGGGNGCGHAAGRRGRGNVNAAVLAGISST